LNFAQRIESVNILDLASQTVTISGWLFSSATVTPTLALATPNAVDNYGSETAVGSVPDLPSVPANTWTRFAVSVALPAAAANGLQVVISWGATGSGVDRYLTGVQLEVGTAATPFERRQFGQELFLCQRYYSEVAVTPTASSIFLYAFLPATMRAAPTISLKAGSLGGATYIVAPYGINASIRQNANSSGATDAHLACTAEL
jgi:hypothetical protein